jgi:hypothetical protein
MRGDSDMSYISVTSEQPPAPATAPFSPSAKTCQGIKHLPGY